MEVVKKKNLIYISSVLGVITVKNQKEELCD